MKLRILILALLAVALFSCDSKDKPAAAPNTETSLQFAPATVVSPAQVTLETSSSTAADTIDFYTLGIATHYNVQINSTTSAGTADWEYDLQVAVDADSSYYATLHTGSVSSDIDTLLTGNINSGRLRLIVSAPSSTQTTAINASIATVKRTP